MSSGEGGGRGPPRADGLARAPRRHVPPPSPAGAACRWVMMPVCGLCGSGGLPGGLMGRKSARPQSPRRGGQAALSGANARPCHSPEVPGALWPPSPGRNSWFPWPRGKPGAAEVTSHWTLPSRARLFLSASLQAVSALTFAKRLRSLRDKKLHFSSFALNPTRRKRGTHAGGE